MIKDILMYMDRNYVPKQKLPTVEHMQTSQFKNHVILYEGIKAKFITKILNEIQQEREGNIVDRTMLRSVITMLVDVGITSKKLYEQEFEGPFIRDTREFYHNYSNSLILKSTCPEFLQVASNRLFLEMELLNNCLDPSTEKVLRQTFLTEFVSNHTEALLKMESSGLVPLIKFEKYSDIGLMYDLFKMVPSSFELLKKYLQSYIIEGGDQLVGDETLKHEEFVTKLIEMKQKANHLLLSSFKEDQVLEISIRAAFETFVNRNNRTAMALVTYLDEQFKKSFKTMSDDDIQEVINKVI
jgi:cullin 3